MKYTNIIEGRFVERPNRFIAYVEIDGKIEICHVKNTGRCKELLIPGCRVFLQVADKPNRKTKYDLIGVMKGNLMINMDSQIPNKVVEEWLKKTQVLFKDPVIYTEKKFGNSRFDLYVEDGDRRAFIEVKGVTLEENGIASFPDAPTERGIKHLRELQSCVEQGYEAYVMFVIQMKGIKKMRPNWERHRAFGETLVLTSQSGVYILAYDCIVSEDTIELDKSIEVDLSVKD